MFVNAKLYYRGTCPTKEYIESLEKKFDMHFVAVELEPITQDVFSYNSSYVSHVICPGNSELSFKDTLYCSYVNYDMPVNGDWDFAVWPGRHYIRCKQGDYQVLTYTRSSAISWFFKKVFCS